MSKCTDCNREMESEFILNNYEEVLQQEVMLYCSNCDIEVTTYISKKKERKND